MAWGDLKDQMNTKVYKGFCIIPGRTYSDDDGGSQQWNIAATIYREGNPDGSRVFVARDEYALTESEAIRRSLEFGEKVIDGAVPDASVSGL